MRDTACSPVAGETGLWGVRSRSCADRCRFRCGFETIFKVAPISVRTHAQRPLHTNLLPIPPTNPIMAREAGTSVAAHPYAVWTEPPVAESRPASGRSDPGAVALPGAVAAEHPRTEYPPVDAAVWQDEALRCLLRSPALLGPRVYRIAVCITLYNESAHEIEATLESLNSCVTCLRNATRRQSMMSLFEVVVVLIQDGWEHPTSREPIVHPTTRDLFTLNGTVPDVWTTSASQSRLSAVVGQRCVDTAEGAGASRPAGACWAKRYPNLDMALIVSKGPNRRKYNSHGWFYAACDGLLKPDFVFLTDAGTTYERDCLRKLVEVLRDNQDVVGATARQRAMTLGSMPWYDSSCGSWVRWFFPPASAQSFKFGFILNLALFTIVGMLPVLPGPCQLIRWNASTKGAFKEYLDIVQPKLTDGFIKALLRLACHRVSSALVVLRSGRRTVWVPRAAYDSPISLASLLSDRRRWSMAVMGVGAYTASHATMLIITFTMLIITFTANMVSKCCAVGSVCMHSSRCAPC